MAQAGKNLVAGKSRVAGKVAIVFGAGSSGPGWGNGKAAAVLYAREGAQVACIDVSQAAADETAAIIRGEGGEAFAAACDVTDEAAVADCVRACAARYARLDILHNNVGITAMGGLVDETLASWKHVIDTNLTSMFLTCKHIVPLMLTGGGGAIVNISSLAGLRYTGYPYTSYYASKAGVQHLTTSIALQYARQGIRANTIAPGMLDTPLIYKQIAGQYGTVEAMVAARDAATPTGRMGDAWDIAHAALFLASDEAKFINGVVLPVDGGQHCTMA